MTLFFHFFLQDSELNMSKSRQLCRYTRFRVWLLSCSEIKSNDGADLGASLRSCHPPQPPHLHGSQWGWTSTLSWGQSLRLGSFTTRLIHNQGGGVHTQRGSHMTGGSSYMVRGLGTHNQWSSYMVRGLGMHNQRSSYMIREMGCIQSELEGKRCLLKQQSDRQPQPTLSPLKKRNIKK